VTEDGNVTSKDRGTRLQIQEGMSIPVSSKIGMRTRKGGQARVGRVEDVRSLNPGGVYWVLSPAALLARVRARVTRRMAGGESDIRERTAEPGL